MISTTTLLVTFTLTLAITSITCLLMMRGRRVWVLTPLLLLLAVSTVYTVDGVKGLPITRVPDQLIVLDYRPVGKDIWIWGIETGSATPRTYKVPYSAPTHEALQKGRDMSRQGQLGMVERNGDDYDPSNVQRFDPLPSKEGPDKDAIDFESGATI
jgi:hypothetical protein